MFEVTERREPESSTVLARVRQAGHPGEEAFAQLFDRLSPRLYKMVHMRLDPRLIGRIDASDIVQETYLEASRRLPEYLRDSRVPIFQWLRFLTNQRITAVHRAHLGAEKRSARREADATRLCRRSADKESLSFEFSGRLTSPSLAAARREMQDCLHDIIASLEPMDREILSLRHFEELSNAEAARELGITPAAASKRYVRALERLRAVAEPLADYCDAS